MSNPGKDTIAQIDVGGTLGQLQLQVFVDHRLDQVDEEVALIFTAQKALSIDEIGVWIVAEVGAAAYKVSLMPLDAAGEPDSGTEHATATTVFSGTGWTWTAMDASFSLVQGTKYAIVFENDSGGQNPDASNFIDIRTWNNKYYPADVVTISTNQGSTWTKQTLLQPFYALRLAATPTDVLGLPCIDIQNLPDTTSVVNEISAQKFILPISMGRRVKIHGAAVQVAHQAQFTIGIWNGAGTAQAETATIDDDPTASVQSLQYRFWSPVWLSTGVTYYLGIKMVEGGGGIVGVYGFDADTDDNLSAWAGYPNNGMSKFISPSWTDSVGHIGWHCSLYVSDWDAHGQEMQHLEAGMVR